MGQWVAVTVERYSHMGNLTNTGACCLRAQWFAGFLAWALRATAPGPGWSGPAFTQDLPPAPQARSQHVDKPEASGRGELPPPLPKEGRSWLVDGQTRGASRRRLIRDVSRGEVAELGVRPGESGAPGACSRPGERGCSVLVLPGPCPQDEVRLPHDTMAKGQRTVPLEVCVTGHRAANWT